MRRARLLAYAGGITGLVSLVFYVVLLIAQDPFPVGSVAFIAIIVAASAAALWAPSHSDRAKQALSWATLGFAIVGFLGLATIGILFVIAAVFTLIAMALLREGPGETS